ncbi:transcription repressor NadR [Lacticaseibacillus pantheris]|jgi:transcriptional regulator of NAD metabolism|uniref:Small molecule binding protein n=1 Tax=Lacticaseibacillus pantheris DSM 15945 = JCM 12539 = NBRC 106106 TaxID=1423783 RepID=A0A0R1U112_9LACO|nr:transcription repressor NadR [Lacticaseibacillus pantheris]KRL86622.1 small molecule binding protein [Lacticaseibacillus pantheris DSM 15945 = JCM 12539 = NBRC 106106]WKF84041.1 transcription repressor NadR [Lacticaseibacillus pantheris]
MNKTDRRTFIQGLISNASEPISATQIARRMGVSRQTIVGDVALLRARGEDIIATPAGYQYNHVDANEVLLVCRHLPADTADEMGRIVALGGIVRDVIVDHPLYGVLRGELNISTPGDIKLFVAKMAAQKGHLLSELTSGIHTHTILYQDEEQLEAIRASLREAGYLYE